MEHHRTAVGDGAGGERSLGLDVGDYRTDDLFRLLAHQRRRFVVQRLRSVEEHSLDDLSREIAAWEDGRPVEEVSPEMAEDIRTSLHHIHVPKLEHAQLVAYDRTHQTVSLQSGAERAKPLLDAIVTD